MLSVFTHSHQSGDMDPESIKSKAMHSGEGPELYSPSHNPPQFRFITVSNPPSGTDAATKMAIRKHVMGGIGRARRLPNRRRKPLTVPLLMPSHDELTQPQLLSNEEKLDEASAADLPQDMANGYHDSNITYHSLRRIGRFRSFHSPLRAENRASESCGQYIPTEALIGKLSWLGAGTVDPFTKYPFEMVRSDHALVAHSKWFDF